MTSRNEFNALDALDASTTVIKPEIQLDCECGAMLVPAPFVENNAMRIAYNCPKHGLIHVVNPFD
ncbi:hypothetical protein B0I08_11253 [Glaciihabitans tibetensis]|uniref:Uncharacterized protein n=1 Tax=Glaciihabitans tibetensis TaxID=1266600 RepID=A0A2T0V3N2_9MICO|nr:hypothetical protein [Glaciihabitans tibetensis]PRY64668.1 hypothetical protein B0I08_11253 [Glaciihabitans tibetensis]